MSSTDYRLKFYPHLKYYDENILPRIIPFAIMAGEKNLQSNIVNTDSHGFRITKSNNIVYKVEDIKNYENVTLFIGSSTVFGVGSSTDEMTLVSKYADYSNEVCFNFGVRGAVSIQELLHLLRVLPEIKSIKNLIILSGVNDLYVNFLTKVISDFDARFEEKGTLHLIYNPIKHILTKILGKIYSVDSTELLPLRIKDMFLFPFVKKKSYPSITDDDRLSLLKKIQTRNFIIYSSLQKQFNCKVSFFLQPFFPWTRKNPSEEELLIFKQLEEMQSYSSFLKTKEQIGRNSIYSEYVKLLKEISTEFGINFYDMNPDFMDPDSLFCDQIHLTDIGCTLAARKIHEFFNSVPYGNV